MGSKDGIIKSRFALFCDNAFTSSDGKLNIIGEFDQLYSTKGKPIIARGFIVGSFESDPNARREIIARLVDDKDLDIMPKQVFNVAFGPNGRANILIEIAGLSFNHSGEYRALFLHKDETLDEASIKVMEGNNHASKGVASIN